jgi:hypothetical protein
MKIAFANFSSAFEPGKGDTLFNFALPTAARNWSTDGREPATAVGYFAGEELESMGVWNITRIKLHWAGSDMTSAGARIVLRLRQPDGGYTFKPLFELLDKNINRGGLGAAVGFSLDSSDDTKRDLKVGWPLARDFVPALDLKLDEPLEAVALLLQVEGHGWLGAGGLEVEGTWGRDVPSDQAEALAERRVGHVWRA